MKQLTEKQFDERDKILEPYFDTTYCKDWFGGLMYIKNVPASVIRELIDKGLADPEDCQNSAPSLEEMCEFCEKHPTYTIHGYVVGRRRDDARVTAEGIESDDMDLDDLQDLLIFRFADDFDIDTKNRSFFCWYD